MCVSHQRDEVSKEVVKMTSYYEIGGEIFDGSFGYDHRKFKRVRREIRRGNNHVVASIIAAEVLDKIAQVKAVEDVPYSMLQLRARKWAERNRRRLQRLVAPLPIPSPVKVAVTATPTVVDMWSRGVGSYDMRPPAVQRYEESVHFGGSGGRII